MTHPAYDAVSLAIMWDRLISVTDEIVSTLVRTSFSTIVRESYDLSVVLMDADGKLMAQGSFSVPVFIGTAPRTLRYMLDKFPPETLKPGDVIATNDPWMGTGHIFDISVMRPVFRGDRLVGYTMSITHLPDIGGLGFGAAATEVFHEGLRLPICKLANEGTLDPFILELVETNVRVPDQTIGDLLANVTCNEVGGRQLLDFMAEYGIEDLGPLSEAIRTQSERAMRDKIAEMTNGAYAHEVQIEGVEGPSTLACTVEVADESIHVDFAGTGGCVRHGINVPLCYTNAMTLYAIKCMTAATIPNNEGFTRPVTVSAPEGCLLHAQPPSPTGGRHIIGHFVPSLIFGALAESAPDKVQADCGMMDLMTIQGTAPNGMTVLEKRFLPDSGGPGAARGGVGQAVHLRNDSGHPMTIFCMANRTEFPPVGFDGGQDGQMREHRINGEVVHPKGSYVLQNGDTITLTQAGGGGVGAPKNRARERVLADIRDGFVSVAGAARDYGIHVNE